MSNDTLNCFQKLPAFLAELHGKGIFFRSIHFGNIVVLSDGNFVLIDISDLQFRKWRDLWIWERVRNFRHLSKYKTDKNALTIFGIEKFIET